MKEFRCPSCGAVLAVSARSAESGKAWTVETVKALFPEELAELLIFQDQGDSVILQPKRFRGTQNFARIAHIIRAAKGEYVSQGRQSHFKIIK